MRVDYHQQFPAGVRAMAGLEQAVRVSTLEPGLLEQVKITGLGAEVTALDGLHVPRRPAHAPGPGKAAAR